MSKLKISVENTESNAKTLYELDLSKNLEENVKDLCEHFSKKYAPNLFGLKLLSKNDGKSLHTYISTDNFHEIKDGYFLKLVYSLSYLVKRIFDHINDEYKERSFQDLYNLSVDPEFIKEIVKTNKHLVIMDIFTNTTLTDSESTACLIAIVHLFQKLCISDITQEFLDKVIKTVKCGIGAELVQYALSVIHKILLHRDPNFSKWKEETIKQLAINDLMNIIKEKNENQLQYGALLVTNALIKCCKGEKRQQLIKEIDSRTFKDIIHTKIIAVGNMDKSMAHELYLYQTHLLSSLAETLNTVAPETEMYERDEFEPLDCEVKKMTLLMDFEEPVTKIKAKSVENLLEYDDVRISLASISSKYSEDSRYSGRVLSTVATDSPQTEIIKPSLLTIEALRHYKKNHYKNFCQTQIEEKIYEPGIMVSSERVVRILAKILHIGMEPDKSSTCYQPNIFTCSSKSPFFFELFSRIMWLLSKTRREMKAVTMQDYDKLIYVLKKQARLVLDQKPADLKQLTQKITETRYQTVVEIWQKEKEEELKNIIAQNPSVQVLKKRFSKQNEEVIFNQRMNYVKKGTLFPKFNEKKINGNFFAKISTDRRHLLINDVDVGAKKHGEVIQISIADITHIVEGKACPLVKNNSIRNSNLAFSILLNNGTWIHFKGADAKVASYWCDSINLLLEKDNRSSYYENELSQLVEMDLVLHLIELQNVPIPKRAPPVPQNPFEIKPVIPPKPQNYPSGFVK